MAFFRTKGYRRNVASTSKVPSDRRFKSGETISSRYSAISIRPGENSCSAALRMEGERFLLAEAPDLPLEACDQTICNCKFRNHADRRSNGDRRESAGQYGRFRPRLGGDERRLSGERRKIKAN